jgi:MoaA/NifB/PqqE/SkfB family radical SAM enzyme
MSPDAPADPMVERPGVQPPVPENGRRLPLAASSASPAAPSTPAPPPVDQPSLESVLAAALALAVSPNPKPVSQLKRTQKRTLTKRGVMWLGQTCNLRCHFCYFLDRIEDSKHPEHAFMPVEKAKKICHTLVHVYGNNAIDIQGGEPTICPYALELVRYCREIGLLPTLITNGLMLADKKRCEEYLKAGIRDFLVSVQGLGAAHDHVVRVRGAHEKQMKGLRNLAEVGIPFRFNCVMSKAATPQLPGVATLAVKTGARAVNFLAFNPFEDQLKAGRRSDENVPRYSEVSGPLNKALDILAEGGVEANVRYYPFCFLEERHRPSNFNFKQLPYDHHEWDYASWSWTQQTAQRVSIGDVSEPPELVRKVRAGILRRPLKYIAGKSPRAKRVLEQGRDVLSKVVTRVGSKDDLYRNNAELRAFDHCGYSYAEACASCSLKSICDGFHGDYAHMFGTSEASTVKMPKPVEDAMHYIHLQSKTVEPEDEGWAL